MKNIVIALVLMVFLTVCNFALADETPFSNSKCDKCHGMPPVEGPEPSKFFGGAHDAHISTRCGDCHGSHYGTFGEDYKDAVDLMFGEDHIDGVVLISPEMNYISGTKIPWPGGGEGKCGGDKNMPMPTGCHTDKIDIVCFWLPGRICKPISAP